MARGSKQAYTAKQKRQASKIEKSVEASGKSAETAARIAWATVNKQDGGGKLSGSGRAKPSAKAGSRRSTRATKKTRPKI